MSKLISNSSVRPFDVNILDVLEMTSKVLDSLMVELVHWTAVDSKVASDMLGVVASCGKSYFSTNTMTSKGGCRYFLFIHEPADII